MAFEVVEQIATWRQRRLVLVLCVAMIALGALMLPIAHQPLTPLPHIAGIYGASAAMIDLATFWLLTSAHEPPRAHRIVAAAYLYAGLMAVLHVLTFPGALLTERAVLGDGSDTGWLMLAWRIGFALMILWAVLAQLRADRGGYRPGSASPALVAGFAVVALYGATALGDMPAYFPTGGSSRFTTAGLAGSYLSAVVAAVVAYLVYRQGLAWRALYLWLVLVLVGEAVAMLLSTHGGGRYTVAWYGARVEGLLANTVVLVMLARHFRELQRTLGSAVADLRARTDALQAEIQRRERVERMLAQSQKLEAVGQLAAGLAHDFNNFMQVISGRLGIIRHRAGPVVDKDLEVIQRNIRKAEGLTRQLMVFSGRRQLQAQVIDVRQVVDDYVELFRPLVRSDIHVETQFAPDLWPVLADPAELEIALANLLNNARDAMPDGGTIRINGYNAPAHGSGEGREQVVLTLQDEGKGIPPEVLERVFEPFFTTKDPGKGTGLGLAQVYAFAKGSQGSAAIDSLPGHGTMVTLRLPRAEAQAASEATTAAAAAAHLPRPGQLVLLVDDNDDVLESSSLLLQQSGFVVKCASSGKAALDKLRDGLRPDIVLSDIVMPGGMSGVALGRAVRQSLPQAKVVLATGYSSAAQEAANDGFPVLQKPYEATALLRAIAS